MSENHSVTEERNLIDYLIPHIHFTHEKLRPGFSKITQLYNSRLGLELRFPDTQARKQLLHVLEQSQQ